MRIFGYTVDISKRKAAEEALEKQKLELKIAKARAEESNRLKTEFINNMSHEIRTPMNGILGFAEMLSMPDLPRKTMQSYTKIILASGQQLMRIIDDILEISELGTKQAQPIIKAMCLHDLLLELFAVFGIKAKEKNIPLYLNVKLSPQECKILSDKSKLAKALSNLLENALKFTNKGTIEMGAYLQGDSIVIYIKDTGVGIEKEKQKIIFERFSQAEKKITKKVGGLGLGLSIAKENVELLNGHITLDSEKGKGSTFSIWLPSGIEKKQKLAQPENLKPNIIKVLIAEDEEVNFLFLEILLLKLDSRVKVIHAKNGQEAIEIYKKNQDIELILMDMKMPIMNGYLATEALLEINPDLPIIAQTAYSLEADILKAKQAGCCDYMIKPIQEKKLKQLLKKRLRPKIKL